MIIEYDENGNIISKEPFNIPFRSSKDFLLQIDAFRKAKKYSFEFLGKILGLKKSSVSRIFAGERGLTLENLVMLLRIFGYRLSIQEIMDGYPEGYEPDIEDDRELCSYELIHQYIGDYKAGCFKGTYEEYLKAISD
ncbi:MAG: helix-turn-helix transcriptional regulator [bacterium]